MSKYGLCGEKLGHSYSKIVHNLLGNSEYELMCFTKAEFYDFMKKRNFNAVNVTIPYKKDALLLCDFVSDSAKTVGSVNTVVNRNGKLYGYNTDIYGFEYMTACKSISFENKKVLILGTGGTSLTAIYAANKLKAKEIIVVSRNGNVNYSNIYEHTDADIIVNTTPVGMYPDNHSCPIDLSRFTFLSGVVDVIYNPHMTKLLQEAKQRNIPYAGGLRMLVAQAVKAHELFYGINIDNIDILTETIYNKCKSMMMNIVLVGMPGSGKTTVGKIISEITNREFIDSDDYISEKYGKTPEEIINTDGIDRFREIESSAIREISSLSGKIISTGGGAILKKENRDFLSQNSIVIYIMRDTDKLETRGRPLSLGGKEKLSKLFEERNSIYKECANFCIDINEDPQKCAQEIINKYL